MRTLTTLGSCVVRVGGLYQGQPASQWKQIRLYVFSFIFDYRHVILAPTLSLLSLLSFCFSRLPPPFWPSFAAGGSLSLSSLLLSSSSVSFCFTSVQAAHLFWLARVQYRVGRCGRKENLFLKKRGGGDDGGVIRRLSLRKARGKKGLMSLQKVYSFL